MDKQVIKCGDTDQLIFVIGKLMEMGLDFTAQADELVIYLRRL